MTAATTLGSVAVAKSSPGLTLILAASVPLLGIGKNNALPWRLSGEIKYFKQVTTRVDPSCPEKPNAIIMGRKTWDSIPARFRPLPDRINVVLTRGNQAAIDTTTSGKDNVLVASSLDDAIDKVGQKAAHIFVIGGAQIYCQALDHPLTQRILLTEVNSTDPEGVAPIDCDTYFDKFPWYPQSAVKPTSKDGGELQWKRQSYEDLKQFVGDQVTSLQPGPIAEKAYTYEFTLWERMA
ncbi:hypothetical protein NADFUDRAFT_53532 [Nadsonia fulvescens var. elongata DSM 6958]|uniref:Dihydrofolate reductase n=1 Tax=Nadsonia fulvescens var. elongata DSM 6958 TaxID=857566 RepID=A0A1E3PD95_9ASCO|nr:hypothetical protein NADFUDRAFT_53532 [Nadsonia fulvescens var. elongata DSM 6958]